LPAYGSPSIGPYNQLTKDTISNTDPSNSAPPYAKNYSAAYPTTYGGWAQLTFYATDKLFFNGLYGFQQNNLTDTFMANLNNAGSTRTLQNYVVNAMYDVNAAVRFALEYTYIVASYANEAYAKDGNGTTWPVGDSKGKINSVRFGAYYFF